MNDYINFFPFLQIIPKSILNASGTQNISDLENLASLCDRGLPNIEGDQAAQQAKSLQTSGQCGHCKHIAASTAFMRF